MNDKVYVLLDIVDGKAEQVVQVLQEIPGVVMVEALEGPKMGGPSERGRPYRSRTCDTLIKRYRRIVLPSEE